MTTDLTASLPEVMSTLALGAVQWPALSTHLGLLLVVILCSTVVYHGLRQENVGVVLRVGVGRAVYFFFLSLLVFGVGGWLIAEWL